MLLGNILCIYMSKCLINESPLTLLPTTATIIGLNETIILQQIHYWLLSPIAHYIDEKFWVFNSVRQWQEDNFPFFSESTIKRTLKNLLKMGLIITANYNIMDVDKTLWYTIDYNKISELDKKCQKLIEKKRIEKALRKNEKPINKLNKCKKSDLKPSRLALGQNDLMVGSNWSNHDIKLTKPIPETTTEITTENKENLSIYPESTNVKSDVSLDENKEKMDGWISISPEDELKNIFEKIELEKLDDKFFVKKTIEKLYLDKSIHRTWKMDISHDDVRDRLKKIDHDDICYALEKFFAENEKSLATQNRPILKKDVYFGKVLMTTALEGRLDYADSYCGTTSEFELRQKEQEKQRKDELYKIQEDFSISLVTELKKLNNIINQDEYDNACNLVILKELNKIKDTEYVPTQKDIEIYKMLAKRDIKFNGDSA